MTIDPRRPWTLILADPADSWSARLIDQCPHPRLVVNPIDPIDAWPEPALAARQVVVHTPALSDHLLRSLTTLRRTVPPATPFLLCQQPLNRYHQVQPHAALFSTILPESTAIETLDRFVAPSPRATLPAIPIAVISSLNEIGGWLTSASLALGLHARHQRKWSNDLTEPLALWDLPVLDDDWEPTLRREARRRAIVVLSGFLDRPFVDRARTLGAQAVLDLPCDNADLAHVLARLVRAVPGQRTHYLDSPSATPPGPSARRRIIIPHPSQARFPWEA